MNMKVCVELLKQNKTRQNTKSTYYNVLSAPWLEERSKERSDPQTDTLIMTDHREPIECPNSHFPSIFPSRMNLKLEVREKN